MIQDKTHLLKFPERTLYNKKLQPHFIRGYFDGDGTIHYKKCNGLKQYHSSIIGTSDFIKSIRKILIEELKINICIENRFYDKTNVVQKLHISGNRQIKIFMDYIYKNAIIKLKRKNDIYHQLLEHLIYIDNLLCIKCSKKVFSKDMCHFHYFEEKLKNNPKLHRSKKIDFDKLLTLLKEEKTKTEIAKIFGIKLTTLCKFIKRHITNMAI